MARSRQRRDSRDIDGLLILDKPGGMTSNQALQRVKNLCRARKAGHCGSLDPLATGVLPICLGQATRFSGYLLGADKAYLATCRLGQTTTTADAEGELLHQAEVDVNPERLESVLAGFRGEITQVPPMHSALKHRGKRLYQLARAGQEVERAPRQVLIHRLECMSIEDTQLKLEVHCSKGTYIRSLAEDIGAALGCGAHLAALHRSTAEPFTDQDAVSLERLEALVRQDNLQSVLLPVDAALAQFSELQLEAETGRRIRQGKRVSPGAPMAAGLYRLRLADGEFIGLGEVENDGDLKAKRLMNTER